MKLVYKWVLCVVFGLACGFLVGTVPAEYKIEQATSILVMVIIACAFGVLDRRQ